ncbi:MAG: hypothetical protein M3P26_01990 [Gemmatimonadota bacterium]|nr:hypothetical protein [Gemmatimonadota bacterium]
MKAHSPKTLGTLALIICAFAASARTLSAQAPTSAKSVIIVVPDEFPTRGARAIVMRDLRPLQEDVIALDRESVTAEGLIAAMSLLQQMRAEPVRAGAATVVATVTGFAPATTLSEEKARKARALLAKLLGRATANVGNLGRGRWLRLDELALGT